MPYYYTSYKLLFIAEALTALKMCWLLFYSQLAKDGTLFRVLGSGTCRMCYFPVMGSVGAGVGGRMIKPNKVKKKSPLSPFSSRIKFLILVSKSMLVLAFSDTHRDLHPLLLELCELSAPNM